MNKYVLRTSLVWMAVLAILAAIWVYRFYWQARPQAMNIQTSGEVQPVAAGRRHLAGNRDGPEERTDDRYEANARERNGRYVMLSRIIELCARNRFLVFTAVLMLTLAGIWSLQHIPLDALPDISDVQVIRSTNALKVINGVKRKLREIAPSLPSGVEIMPGYDRSGLIGASIKTLQRDLLEEAIIVSVVIIVFLFHSRSALIAILALPIAVLVSFIPMYWLGVTSNIMWLGGIALAIGVLVDASIVMVENGYRHLSERQEHDPTPVSGPERKTILISTAKQVGPALVFSLLIIVVFFLPVFLLEAQEGRMFRPLAWTKTLAVGSSSILAITLVPVLMVMLIRGKLRPESANPISRITLEWSSVSVRTFFR